MCHLPFGLDAKGQPSRLERRSRGKKLLHNKKLGGVHSESELPGGVRKGTKKKKNLGRPAVRIGRVRIKTKTVAGQNRLLHG